MLIITSYKFPNQQKEHSVTSVKSTIKQLKEQQVVTILKGTVIREQTIQVKCN